MGVVHLLGAGRELLFGTAIYYGGVRSEPQGRACGIHSHVSATYHHAFLSGVYRREIILPEGFHQVVSGEELIGGEYSVEVLARYAHKLRESGSGADEDRIEALPVEKAVYGHGASGNHVCLYLHSEGFHRLYFVGDHTVLRKTELGNSVNEHSSRLVQGLENGHLVSGLGKVARTGQSGRT